MMTVLPTIKKSAKLIHSLKMITDDKDGIANSREKVLNQHYRVFANETRWF